MIRGYAKNCDPNASILLYVEMQEREVEPNNFTYPSLLKACSHLSSLKEGMQIHGHVVKFGFDTNIFVQNSLISFYGKCEETKLCYKVFELMNQKVLPLGVHLFLLMLRDGKFRADESIAVGVLSSSANKGDLNLGRCTHGSLLRAFNGLNIVVETSLIDMYVKCGSLNKGKYLFEEMVVKNKLTYSVMVSGLANHGRAEEAIIVFSDMLEEGFEPDDITYVGVLRTCSYAGLVNKVTNILI
ncbi:hypothetical protein GIB67_041996 [Kingdonia uniflora]|uniref:Pentatricopeptide repeat-containing protein n=1 Tax=Kingdonia uniflora TaxID=39325 RepID=A0A7J7P000_9MAGN|nr:hypothetical protein GIB67_041996 [Kingdonia uniflora]